MTFQKIADVCVLVGIGIFVGLMIADASAAAVQFREWQALTAGILAVIAAAWTVREMRRNDGTQQARHEELLSLALRTDAVKAQRVEKFVSPLAGLQKSAKENLAAGSKGEIGQDVRFLIESIDSLNQIATRISRTRSLAESYDIFDADTAYAYDVFLSTAGATTMDIVEWRKQVDHFAGGAAKLERMQIEIRKRISLLGKYAAKLSTELQKLADKYSGAVL